MSIVADGGTLVGEAVSGGYADGRCIVYARVSTEDQARKGYSLADQVESCIARGLQLGYKRDQIIVLKDEGMSGDLVDRPGLNRLRELVSEARAVGHVIIYDPDRFARNLSLQLIVTEEIVKGGAALEFINFEWKNTPEGKLFYSLRGAIAEYEKAKIKERTRRGREQKAKQGLMPVGKDLFGYKFNPDTDKLEPNEEEQAVLRLIRDLILHGAPGEGKPLSCVQAAKWLATNGVPAPKGNKWYASTITRMIRNESYTGTYWVFKTDSTSGKRTARPREQQYKVEIPPVWDEATWHALVARIEKNKWLKRGRKSHGNYLLKGLIYCGVCGDGVIKMRGNSIKDHRRDYQYYICYKNHGRAAFDATTGEKVRCPSRHWPARQIDDMVWDLLKETARNPRRMVEMFNDKLKGPDQTERLAADLNALQTAISQKEAECDRYLRLFAMGHIDEAKLDEMLKPAKTELAALKERRDEVDAALKALRAERQDMEDYLLAFEEVAQTIDDIQDDDFEKKREILPKLVKRVIVEKERVRIIGYLSIPFDGEALTGPSTPHAHGHVNSSAVRQLER